jgi:thiamine biosynthesis protein ThiS
MIIRIYINNFEIPVPKDCTLNQALVSWLSNPAKNQNETTPDSYTDNYTDNYVVALNQKFISKALYDTVILKNYDDIELLTPMAGG